MLYLDLVVCLSMPAVIGIIVGALSLILLLVIWAEVFLAKKWKNEDKKGDASKKDAPSASEEADPSLASEAAPKEEKPTLEAFSVPARPAPAITLTSSYNRGLGLWTSLCVGFSNIFGCHCKAYDKKVKSIASKIKKDLESQMESYSSLYEFGDIRITSDRSLSFLGSVTGKLKGK